MCFKSRITKYLSPALKLSYVFFSCAHGGDMNFGHLPPIRVLNKDYLFLLLLLLDSRF
jgi:hypothetical protein